MYKAFSFNIKVCFEPLSIVLSAGFKKCVQFSSFYIYTEGEVRKVRWGTLYSFYGIFFLSCIYVFLVAWILNSNFPFIYCALLYVLSKVSYIMDLKDVRIFILKSIMYKLRRKGLWPLGHLITNETNENWWWLTKKLKKFKNLIKNCCQYILWNRCWRGRFKESFYLKS